MFYVLQYQLTLFFFSLKKGNIHPWEFTICEVGAQNAFWQLGYRKPLRDTALSGNTDIILTIVAGAVPVKQNVLEAQCEAESPRLPRSQFLWKKTWWKICARLFLGLGKNTHSLYIPVPVVIGCITLRLAHGKRCWGSSLPQEGRGTRCSQGASRKKPLPLHFLLFPASPLTHVRQVSTDFKLFTVILLSLPGMGEEGEGFAQQLLWHISGPEGTVIKGILLRWYGWSQNTTSARNLCFPAAGWTLWHFLWQCDRPWHFKPLCAGLCLVFTSCVRKRNAPKNK